ncbi:MAG: alpha-galactosidase [Proteiniphilum sp.]|nr:alpha-galactosidase [Proteiniphilum sp.]
MHYKHFTLAVLLYFFTFYLSASVDDCYARLDSGILSIGNSLIERNFLWNDGQLITLSIHDKENGKIWLNQQKTIDLYIPGISKAAVKGIWSSTIQEETSITSAHLLVNVEYQIGQLYIRRAFRVYPDCPAIAADTYFKSLSLAADWNISQNEVIDQLSLPGKHWRMEAIEFFDTSDEHNTFIEKTSRLSYKTNSYYRGNLLFAHNLEDGTGLFLLKEAPCSINQLHYPGHDFETNYGTIKVTGLGVHPVDLQKMDGEWVKAYGAVVGVYDGSNNARLLALRTYQKNTRTFQKGRENMIVMNTWGDRGKLDRLTESFCKEQMKACSSIGITHFQLDWGWQEGIKDKTTKSIDAWVPKNTLFPNGFGPLIAYGRKMGVELCLYFVPKFHNNNGAWEEDADALINLYKNHGVRIFKIDGQKIPSKMAEINLRKMYDKVLKETDYKVVFNLDITNGPRGGYFYMNETGNLFVENRYTQFGTYYPFHTLRNLWMLSHYVAPERLQFEFLNKWKNQDKYPAGDRFAPAAYSFDYLFAITMVAQPLAFFDATDLPDAALDNERLIKKYREIQFDLQNGSTFPVGDEPNGRSWTGFQSIHHDRGYFILFRENNDEPTKTIETFLEEGCEVVLQPLFGHKAASRQKVGRSGTLTFSLPENNSFEVYAYSVK